MRGLLLSRELVAKERGVNFILTEESFLFGNHNYVDSYDIVTILGNLIENAFDSCVCSNIENKEVEVTLYEDDEKIEMQVRDNGKSIDNNIKERIFELGVSSKGEGRGTGLSLVKNRVELYDGCIDIEEFNEEKIFIITILKGEKIMGKKILIVEDDPMVALINKRFLENMGFKNILGPVQTEEEIIKVLDKENIDLILLDVYLPKKNGIDILKSLRYKKYLTDVIMITAANSVEEVKKSLCLWGN